jgi:hypothetical protein
MSVLPWWRARSRAREKGRVALVRALAGPGNAESPTLFPHAPPVAAEQNDHKRCEHEKKQPAVVLQELGAQSRELGRQIGMADYRNEKVMRVRVEPRTGAIRNHVARHPLIVLLVVNVPADVRARHQTPVARYQLSIPIAEKKLVEGERWEEKGAILPVVLRVEQRRAESCIINVHGEYHCTQERRSHHPRQAHGGRQGEDPFRALVMASTILCRDEAQGHEWSQSAEQTDEEQPRLGVGSRLDDIATAALIWYGGKIKWLGISAAGREYPGKGRGCHPGFDVSEGEL